MPELNDNTEFQNFVLCDFFSRSPSITKNKKKHISNKNRTYKRQGIKPHNNALTHDICYTTLHLKVQTTQPYLHFLWRFKAASTTRRKKATEPRRERTRAAATWWQNSSNTLHTLFHRTCELPLQPMIPTAAAAPSPENKSATIIMSMIVIISANHFFPPLLANVRTRDRAAQVHAMEFATTKYLNQRCKIWLLQQYF